MNKLGQRETKQRKIILKALSNLTTPSTVKEISGCLKNKVDTVSIYRTLSLMKKNNLVNVILFGDGKKRYELISSKNHHHHLICEGCGKIEDVEIKEEVLIKSIKNNHDFFIKKHNLEFFGLCKDCN